MEDFVESEFTRQLINDPVTIPLDPHGNLDEFEDFYFDVESIEFSAARSFGIQTDSSTTDKRHIIQRLPLDLHPKIMKYLDIRDFYSLLLVDRAFSSIAKSYLYADILLNHSNRSFKFIESLTNSLISAFKGHWSMYVANQNLRLTIDTDRLIFLVNHTNFDIEGSTGNARQLQLADGLHEYQRYLRVIEILFQVGFLNLQCFQFKDETTIPDSLLQCVLERESLQSLLIHRAFFDILKPPVSVDSIESNQLKNIHIVYSIPYSLSVSPEYSDLPISDNAINIIVKAAPTLERLCFGRSYQTQKSTDTHIVRDSSNFSVLANVSGFPKLRDLKLVEWVPVECFDSFINGAPDLRNLVCKLVRGDIQGWLDSHGSITGLNSLTLNMTYNIVSEKSNLYDGVPYKFIGNQAGLKSLCLANKVRPVVLRKLCPILRENCPLISNLLVQLSAAPSYSELAQLGTVSTLKRLQVSVGESNNYIWQINHDEMREILAPLQDLEWLAFEQDSYVIEEGQHLDRYYSYLIDKESINDHMDRILIIAQTYAIAFPKLKTICVGKLIFDISNDDGVNPRFNALDENYSYLKQFWKLGKFLD